MLTFKKLEKLYAISNIKYDKTEADEIFYEINEITGIMDEIFSVKPLSDFKDIEQKAYDIEEFREDEIGSSQYIKNNDDNKEVPSGKNLLSKSDNFYDGSVVVKKPF